MPAQLPSPPAQIFSTSGDAKSGNWRAVLTLLLLSPAVGELLSGSSPPLQFFNPALFLLLVGLYGCGALLVRETVRRFRLNVFGLLLLGAAYGIVEEGLACKSFFNPHWKDVGYLSVYGRALGVNWIWTLGLTFYHTFISIAAPIFLTEALFSSRAQQPWLHRRGWCLASVSLLLVTVLGFASFDSPEFHLLEIKDAKSLARKLLTPSEPVTQFIAARLKPVNRQTLAAFLEGNESLPKARTALLDELNHLLIAPDLFSRERFGAVILPTETLTLAGTSPKGDKRVKLNRAVLEAAFPPELKQRPRGTFRPPWGTTALSCLFIVALVLIALRQTTPQITQSRLRPWANGLWFTPAFAAAGFVVPGLVEEGARVPAWAMAVVWLGLGFFVATTLRRYDAEPAERLCRGLWAVGALTPWALFGLLMGLVVQMQGGKSYAGMPIVSLACACAVVYLTIKWKRELRPPCGTAETTA